MSAGDTILVSGGAGFIGSNLADRLAAQGKRVRIFDNLSRPGVEDNLAWLTGRHGDAIEPVTGDVRDETAVAAATRGVAAAFHFAAQVAVTTSMVDPTTDFDVNLRGTFHLLEGLRSQSARAPVIFASTNKVYGDLADVEMSLSDAGHTPQVPELARWGVSERQPLDFHTPYGCSKGAADQYVLDYARSFAMRTAVVRMSCIYGQRQMGTEDQGWVAHFLIKALEGQTITLFGDGEQVRDVCDVADVCALYLGALEQIDRISGRAFNWGGGPDNAVSLRTVIAEIGAITGEPPRIEFADWRPGDQRWFVADTRLAASTLGLAPQKGWRQGLRDLAAWLCEARGLSLPAHTPALAAATS